MTNSNFRKQFLFVLTMTLLTITTLAQDDIVKDSVSSTPLIKSEFTSSDSTEAISPNKIYEGYSDDEINSILNAGSEAIAPDTTPRVEFAIKVIDETSKKPLEAYIELTAKTGSGKILTGQGFCNSKGIFKMQLLADSKIKIKISHSTYLAVSDAVNIQGLYEKKGKTEIKKMFKLKPVNEGDIINLDKITFQQGQSKLAKKSFRQLDELALMMEVTPGLKIELAGHTDDTGSPSASQKLSEERVAAVKLYLVDKKGIDTKRIKEIGYGSTKPIAKGTDASSREKNRRVEFKILNL